MPKDPEFLLHRWSAADRLASAAERVVLDKSVAFALGQGGHPPTAAEIQEAKQLRVLAAALLEQTLEQVRRTQEDVRQGWASSPAPLGD